MALALAVAGSFGALSTWLYAWLANPIFRAVRDVQGLQNGTIPSQPANAQAIKDPINSLDAAGIPAFFEKVIFQDRDGPLLLVAAGVIAATLVRAAAHYARIRLTSSLEEGVGYDLRVRVFRDLLEQPHTRWANLGRGELGERLAHAAAQVQAALSHTLGAGLQSLLTALVLTGYVIWMSPALGLTALGLLPGVAWVLVRAARKLHEAHRRKWAAYGHVAADVVELTQMGPLARAYNAQAQLTDRFEATAEEARRACLREARIRAHVGPTVDLCAGVLVVVVLGALVRWGVSDQNPAAYASTLVALALLYRPVRSLAGLGQGLSAGFAALERLEALRSSETNTGKHRSEVAGPTPECRDNATAQKASRSLGAGRLELCEVGLRYGSYAALKGVTLAIEPGERLAIVGPNGSGKTSLLYVLLGLVEPSEGCVRVDGLRIDAETQDVLRRCSSWVPQRPLLLSGTVLQNVTLGATAPPNEPRLAQALERSGVSRLVARLPQGVHSLLGEGGADLSVGERQRICIARALYRAAPVLVLDEPDASLDAPTRTQFRAMLASKGSIHTAVFTTHDESLLRLADRVVSLDEGRVVDVQRITHDAAYEALGRAPETGLS